jgi:hypothetical protein
MKINRLPAQKNKPNSNPISSKAKMNLKLLARKSGKFAIRKKLGFFQYIPNYS